MKTDLLLYNATVLTMDPHQPRAEVVAIGGERIVAVGGREMREALAGAGTQRLDCAGKVVVPGFIDAHCHILAYLHSRLSVDCSRAGSIEEIKSLIRERAERVAPGSWVHAHGYDEFRLGEHRHPTRWDLDQAAPHHPTHLRHRTGHACVLNSLALTQVGIAIDTAEPPGGLIDRDLDTGQPNGRLFEMNAYLQERIPPLTPQEIEAGLALANPDYLSCGLTSLHDASVTNDLAQRELFCQLNREGKLLPRVSLLIGRGALGELSGPERGGEGMPPPGIKLVLDETTGSVYPPQPEIEAVVLEAHRRGFQVAIHAIEEAAVAAAAAAIEKALGCLPRPHRHRIEHCSVCPPPLLERLKALGMVVVTQPPFIYYTGEKYLTTVPPAQFPYLYRIRSWLRGGLRVAGSSDSPVVPHHPLMGIYAAVTRRAETGGEVVAEEAISAEEALTMYTRDAAYACLAEGEKGSIAAGKLADLCLLSADPTRVEAEALKEIKVEMTLLGGKVVWAD